ncbi:MAG: biotin/lipoyl-containing protein [Negativicutes bacterium]
MGFLSSLFGSGKQETTQTDPGPIQAATLSTSVLAPMPGRVSKIVVREGQTVKDGDPVIMLEAMKMQNEISSPINGIVNFIVVSAGDAVKAGAVMAVIESVAGARAIPAPALAPEPLAPVQITAGETIVSAPMPGKVSKIIKKAGDKIDQGECLMTLEAMKMQNEIGAPVAGIIKSINVTKGDGVKPGQTMAVISN